jgi:hypothetical protein
MVFHPEGVHPGLQEKTLQRGVRETRCRDLDILCPRGPQGFCRVCGLICGHIENRGSRRPAGGFDHGAGDLPGPPKESENRLGWGLSHGKDLNTPSIGLLFTYRIRLLAIKNVKFGIECALFPSLDFKFRYEFSSLKYRLRNPSRPPFSKGRRAFLNVSAEKSLFSPLKRGMKGDLMVFQKAKGLQILHFAFKHY